MNSLVMSPPETVGRQIVCDIVPHVFRGLCRIAEIGRPTATHTSGILIDPQCQRLVAINNFAALLVPYEVKRFDFLLPFMLPYETCRALCDHLPSASKFVVRVSEIRLKRCRVSVDNAPPGFHRQDLEYCRIDYDERFPKPSGIPASFNPARQHIIENAMRQLAESNSLRVQLKHNGVGPAALYAPSARYMLGSLLPLPVLADDEHTLDEIRQKLELDVAQEPQS